MHEPWIDELEDPFDPVTLLESVLGPEKPRQSAHLPLGVLEEPLIVNDDPRPIGGVSERRRGMSKPIQRAFLEPGFLALAQAKRVGDIYRVRTQTT